MSSQRGHDLLDTGTTAPDFRIARLEGGEASLTELVAHGPAVLAFFKITCPVCQMTFPFLERIHAAAKEALPIYGISQNGPRETRDFARQFGVTFPMLLDSEDDHFPVSNAYGLSTVPTIYVVDRGGAISSVVEGWSRRDIVALGQRAGVNPLRPSDNVPELKAG